MKTFKRDYVAINRLTSAQIVLEQLPAWFADYNLVHPRSALKYRSPDEFREEQLSQTDCPL